MISDSKNYIRDVTEWVDEIEDVDAFLEQLFLINEQSLETSPSLDTFCMSLSINTTESLISAKDDSLYADVFRKIENCSSSPILESKMNIPESIFNISLFEKIEDAQNAASCNGPGASCHSSVIASRRSCRLSCHC